jgi:hypothetical protein
MSAPAQPPIEIGPEWVIAEMPPGYRTRVAEIQRLTADLQAMSRFGRLLCEVGTPLAEAVQDVFTAIKFDAELTAGPGCADVVVRLDGGRRLLLHVAADRQPLQRKSTEIAHTFQILHEVANEFDRVVLVTNAEPDTPPSNRGGAVTAEALAFLSRMRASHVAAPTLFQVWKLSLQEPGRARELVERLHADPGGTFEVPSALLA